MNIITMHYLLYSNHFKVVQIKMIKITLLRKMNGLIILALKIY